MGTLGVSIADGQVIPVEGIIWNLSWKIHHLTFQDDIYVMKLGGCDMVLGVQWMDLLGDITWNTKKSTMSFKYQGKKKVLRGASQLHPGKLKSHKVEKLLQQGAEAYSVQLGRAGSWKLGMKEYDSRTSHWC